MQLKITAANSGISLFKNTVTKIMLSAKLIKLSAFASNQQLL